MKPSQIELSREELYELIWSKPADTLAKELGITGTGLAKICKRFDIPRPGNGYWMKKEAGTAPQPSPLPPALEIATQTITIKRSKKKKKALPEDEKVVVPDSLDNPHPLVAETLQRLKSVQPNERGLLVGHTCGVLDISVPPDDLDRACRIFDGFIKHIISLGGDFKTVKVTINPYLDDVLRSIATVEGAEFDIAIQPRPNRSKRKETKGLQIESRTLYRNTRRSCWSESENVPLESLLSSLMKALHRAAPSVRDRQEESRKIAAQEAHERHLRELREQEAGKLKQLYKEASEWQHVKMLREYINAAEETQAKSTEWITWARREADRRDPLTTLVQIEPDTFE